MSNATHLCLVRVRNSAREHKIDVFDDGFEPSLLSVTEGDSVWWHWNKKNVRSKPFIVLWYSVVDSMGREFDIRGYNQ